MGKLISWARGVIIVAMLAAVKPIDEIECDVNRRVLERDQR